MTKLFGASLVSTRIPSKWLAFLKLHRLHLEEQPAANTTHARTSGQFPEIDIGNSGSPGLVKVRGRRAPKKKQTPKT